MNEIIERHPNPQFARENIYLLDGEWEISLNGESMQKIRVPYCPESELSGIAHKDFIRECEYRKRFVLPESMCGKRVLLRFGAVNYFARVYVNGKCAGSHAGGYTPFCFDVTDFLKRDENLIDVCVRNDLAERNPSGKQSPKRESFGCFYTRCTGIWQSVWIESVPSVYLKSVRILPNETKTAIHMKLLAEGKAEFYAEVSVCGKKTGECGGLLNNKGSFTVSLSEKQLWEIGNGQLYEVKMRFGQDEVYTYFGLRDVKYEGYCFLLNGKSVFQRLVLDQGYYPRGVYTPESKEDFGKDIVRAQELGFNGARLHQKVFDPHYLYECDKRGFMVWGEYASWGINYSDLTKFGQFIDEWREAVERDINHPCIVVWCPLNETWGDLEDAAKTRDVRFVDAVYALTKILDSTRPCVDVSGGMHGAKTDIADYHCYDGYERLKARLDKAQRGEMQFLNMYLTGEGNEYHGEPQHLSEFGGISYGGKCIEQSQCVQETVAWGYDALSDEESFIANYEALAGLILGYKQLSGFCYTQLYDVEQEQNGLYTYERKVKFSEKGMMRICNANLQQAEIEKSM